MEPRRFSDLGKKNETCGFLFLFFFVLFGPSTANQRPASSSGSFVFFFGSIDKPSAFYQSDENDEENNTHTHTHTHNNKKKEKEEPSAHLTGHVIGVPSNFIDVLFGVALLGKRRPASVVDGAGQREGHARAEAREARNGATKNKTNKRNDIVHHVGLFDRRQKGPTR